MKISNRVVHLLPSLFMSTRVVLVIALLGMSSIAAQGQPSPTTQAAPGTEKLQDVLIAGEDWKLVAQNFRSTDGPAVNSKGEVFFNDGRSDKTLKIALDGKVSDFVADTHRGAGEAVGTDGRIYSAADATDQIIATDGNGKSVVFTEGIHANDLTIAFNGNMYVTQSPIKVGEIGKVWLVSPKGEKKLVDPDFSFPNGLALSPDQSVLYVGDYRSHWVYSYAILPDGSLGPKQQFADLYVPSGAKDSAADGMRVDRDGRLYTTTRSGIQVCDASGHLLGIITVPAPRVSNLTFGGAELDAIYATCGDKIFARKVKARGVLPFESPIKTAAQ
jgi:sugar lactone lactonase YvrE